MMILSGGLSARSLLAMFAVWLVAGGLVVASVTVPERASAQTGQPWQQLGIDIDGAAAGDESGQAVDISSDGATVIVGAPRAGSFGGQVSVFQFDGSGWAQLGSDIDGNPGEVLGEGVAISADGTRIVVGGSSIGQVFDWDGSSWNQSGSFSTGPITDVDISDSGDRVVFSSWGPGSTPVVQVSTYELVGSSWNLLGAVLDGGHSGSDNGTSVALSGDGSTVIVGAPDFIAAPGLARIFRWDGAAWQQLGSDLQSSEVGYGWAVDIANDGNTVVVGSSGQTFGSSAPSVAEVHRWNGSAWVQLGADFQSVSLGIDPFGGLDIFDTNGRGVGLSGDGNSVVIGAPAFGSSFPGMVRAFDWDGTAWAQSGLDLIGEANGDSFGDSVAMSSDGSRIVAGAPRNDGGGSDAGHVRVFEFSTPAALCNGLVVDVDISAGDSPTFGDDVILGTSGPDLINGLAGNDTICGEGGDDILNGGSGVDIIFGGDGDDTIGGQGDADTLYGEGGADRLNGGVGEDTLWGGDGDDDLRGQGDADTLNGEAGVDNLFGGSGNDTLNTGDGGNLGTSQFVRGQGNNDVITGSPQADDLEGGSGLDELFGEGGDDRLRGGNASDDLYGGPGNDTLEGGASRDFLYGGIGNDELAGGTGNDDLFGEAGADDLNGQGDTDLCDGGADTDTDTATATCETLTNVP